MRLSVRILTLLSLALTSSADPFSEALEDFTGHPTKAVWAQSLTPPHKDTFLMGREHALMGIDTSDGEGIRVLRGDVGNYRKPLVLPDGSGIVYSDTASGKSFTLNWDGSGHRELATGMVAAVTKDPETKETLVWALRSPTLPAGQYNAAQLVRFPFDDPDSAEVVWEGQEVSLDNLQISRDGTHFGALFPWPYAGLANLETGAWEQYSRGCWTSLSPDNNKVLWVFDGAHQNVTLFTQEPAKSWLMNMNNHPLLQGHETYHPRWSNDPHFIALTGPYKKDAGGMAAVFAGGEEVEVFLGKLSPDLSGVAEWFPLTNNQVGDFGPDLWIEGGDTRSLDMALVTEGKPDGKTLDGLAAEGWLANTDGLAFGWNHANAANQVPVGDKTIAARLEPTGLSRFGQFHELLLQGGGSDVAEELAHQFANGAKESNEFSFEIFAQGRQNPDQAGVILASAHPSGGVNFLLMESRGQLYLSVSGGMNNDEPGKAVPIFTPPQGRPYHLIVTAKKGALSLYHDGKSIGAIPGYRCDLAGWGAGALSIGCVPGGANPWEGSLEKVALYTRALDETEIFAKGTVISNEISKRTASPRISTAAKLVAVSNVPTLEELGSYKRGLVSYTYELDAAASKEARTDKVTVLHWAVLDREPTGGFPRKVGDNYQLYIEPFDSHPELRPEWTSAAPDPLLPVYFDVTAPRQ